jgi:hypothetical protein
VSGYTLAAIAVRAPVQLLVCKLNILEACANGILMTDDGAGGAVAIENNQLRDIGNAADAAIVVGIGLARVDGAAVSGNSFLRIGNRAGDTALRAGVFGVAVTRLRAHGNQLADLGPPDDFGGLAAGILLGGPYLQLDVQHNQIERDSVPTDRPGRGAWIGLFVGGSAQAAADPNDRLAPTRYARVSTVPVDARSTLVVSGNKAFVAATAAAAAVEPGGGASVLGNVFTARSTQPAVLVLAERECLFSDNRVDHAGVGGLPAVRLLSPIVIANGNRVRNRADIALDIPLTKIVAAVANITTGILNAPGLKPEFQPLNLRA